MAEPREPVRLPPLEEDEWDESTRDLLKTSWLAGALAPAKPSTIRATLIRHRRLFEAWDPFGAALFNGELPERDREVIVLRVAWHAQCRLEWAYHGDPAKRAGITSADIDAIIEGPSSAALNDWDRVLVSAVDQLYEHGVIDRPTWDTLAAHYTVEQLIEVPIVAGQYLMIAYAVNSFGTPVPDELPKLPVRDAGSPTAPAG